MDELTRLAISARDGDRRALERFVRAVQGDVWRYVRHLADPIDVDDVAQDALMRILRALPAFRGEASARTWALGIANRACADQVRRRARRRRLLERLTALSTPGEVSRQDCTSGQALGDLVGALADDRRAAFVLTQINGLSYEAAADVLGCPIGTVRSRVSRAREQLVALVRASGSDPATGKLA